VTRLREVGRRFISARLSQAIERVVHRGTVGEQQCATGASTMTEAAAAAARPAVARPAVALQAPVDRCRGRYPPAGPGCGPAVPVPAAAQQERPVRAGRVRAPRGRAPSEPPAVRAPDPRPERCRGRSPDRRHQVMEAPLPPARDRQATPRTPRVAVPPRSERDGKPAAVSASQRPESRTT